MLMHQFSAIIVIPHFVIGVTYGNHGMEYVYGMIRFQREFNHDTILCLVTYYGYCWNVDILYDIASISVCIHCCTCSVIRVT